LTPAAVPWLSGVAWIGTGDSYSVALKTDGRSSGSVWTWGAPWSGRLGYPASTVVTRPSLVVGDVMALAVGRAHTLALRRDGQVLAWGEGGSGQIGDGARQSRSSPVFLAGLGEALAFAAGDWDSRRVAS
jgi:alpha-tubulin suppressor-like RCC1 family protein